MSVELSPNGAFAEIYLRLIGEPDHEIVVRGTRFKVHKNLLKEFSLVFRSMFDERYKQDEKTELDHDPGIFGKLVSIMYSKKIDVLVEELAEMLNLIDFYELVFPVKKLEKLLIESITKKNVVAVCNKLIDERIKNICLNKLVRYFDKYDYEPLDNIALLIEVIRKYEGTCKHCISLKENETCKIKLSSHLTPFYVNGCKILKQMLDQRERSIFEVGELLLVDKIFMNCPACQKVNQRFSQVLTCSCGFCGYTMKCAHCSVLNVDEYSYESLCREAPTNFSCTSCQNKNLIVYCDKCEDQLSLKEISSSFVHTHEKCGAKINLMTYRDDSIMKVGIASGDDSIMKVGIASGDKIEGIEITTRTGTKLVEFSCKKCGEWFSCSTLKLYDNKKTCSCGDNFNIMLCHYCNRFVCYTDKETVICSFCEGENKMIKCEECDGKKFETIGTQRIFRCSNRVCNIDMKMIKCPDCDLSSYQNIYKDKDVTCQTCGCLYHIAHHPEVARNFYCGHTGAYKGKLGTQQRCQSCHTLFKGKNKKFFTKMIEKLRS